MHYCHVHHVAHRDLKLDNTLLDGSDPPYIKIADFGFAKDWGDTEAQMYTQIGTPVYMSPQVGCAGDVPQCAPVVVDSRLPRHVSAGMLCALSTNGTPTHPLCVGGGGGWGSRPGQWDASASRARAIAPKRSTSVGLSRITAIVLHCFIHYYRANTASTASHLLWVCALSSRCRHLCILKKHLAWLRDPYSYNAPYWVPAIAFPTSYCS